MIELYYTAIPPNGTPDLSRMPDSIADHIQHRGPIARRQSATAWELLIRALTDHGLDRSSILLHFSENGRPSLSSHPHLTFSLTHTNTLAAVAVCDDETSIGLDAEPITDSPRISRIANRFFSPNEKNADSPPILIWTRKEALLKYLDLTALPDTAHADVHFTTFSLDGHYLTLCTKNKPTVKLIPIDTI